MPPPPMVPNPRWLDLWRSARWPARALFLALAALFVARAVYEPQGPCDLGGFLDIGDGVLDGRLLRDTFINSYPPTFSVAMAPLSALARVTSRLLVRHLWGLGQLAALAYFTLGFARLMRLRLSLGAVALAWLCTWRYVVGDLNNQNVSLFLWALTALALGRAAEGRSAAAGLLLGVGSALKIMPGFAAVALVEPRAPRRGSIVAAFAAGALLAVAVTMLVLGPRFGEAMRFWLGRIVPSFGGPWPGNQGWNGLFQRLAGPGMPPPRLLASAVGLLVLGGLTAWLFLRPAASPRVRALDAALAILAGLPALPIAWFHYYTAAIPVALAVAASWTRLEQGPRRTAGGLLAAGTLLGAFLDVDVVGAKAWAFAARYGNALFGALLVLAAGLVLRAAWRREDAEGGESRGELSGTP